MGEHKNAGRAAAAHTLSNIGSEDSAHSSDLSDYASNNRKRGNF